MAVKPGTNCTSCTIYMKIAIICYNSIHRKFPGSRLIKENMAAGYTHYIHFKKAVLDESCVCLYNHFMMSANPSIIVDDKMCAGSKCDSIGDNYRVLN